MHPAVWFAVAPYPVSGSASGRQTVEVRAADKKINIDDLITHTMPLERINDAFDLMHEGKSIRSVVIF